MKILKVSHNDTQVVITIYKYTGMYEIYLYNENGHSELHSISNDHDNALMYHQFLCEKCGISC